jgi:hypothetical protein
VGLSLNFSPTVIEAVVEPPARSPLGRGGNSGRHVGFGSGPIMTRHDYVQHDTTRLINRVEPSDPNTTRSING